MRKLILLLSLPIFYTTHTVAYYEAPSIEIIQKIKLIEALDHLRHKECSVQEQLAHLKLIDFILQKSFSNKPNELRDFEGNAVIETELSSKIYEDVVFVILDTLSKVHAKNKDLLNTYEKLSGANLSTLENEVILPDITRINDKILKALVYLITDNGFIFFDRMTSIYIEAGQWEAALKILVLLKKYSQKFHQLPKMERIEFIAKLGFLYDKLNLHAQLNQLLLENTWDLSTFDIIQLPNDFKFKKLLMDLNRKSLYQDTVGQALPDISADFSNYDKSPIRRVHNLICKNDDWCYAGHDIEFTGYLHLPGKENKVYALGSETPEKVRQRLVMIVLEEKTGKLLRRQFLGYGVGSEPGFVYHNNHINIFTEHVFIQLNSLGELARVFQTSEASEDDLKNVDSMSQHEFITLSLDYFQKRVGSFYYSLNINPIFFNELALRLYKEPDEYPYQHTLNAVNFYIYQEATDLAMIGIMKFMNYLLNEKNVYNRELLYSIIEKNYNRAHDPLKIAIKTQMEPLVTEEKKRTEHLQAVKKNDLYNHGKLTCNPMNHFGFIADHTSPGSIYFSCTDTESGIEYKIHIWGVGISLTAGGDFEPKIFYEGTGDIVGKFTGIQASAGFILGGDCGVFNNGKMRLQYVSSSISVGITFSLISFMEVTQTTLPDQMNRHTLTSLYEALF